MPLDPSIPWGNYNAAQDRRRLGLAKRGLDIQERGQQIDADMARAKLEQAGMDVDMLADRALIKMQTGQPLNEAEKAGLQVWDSKRQTELTPDMEGNLHPSKRSIYDVLKGAGGMQTPDFNPAARRAAGGFDNLEPGTWHQKGAGVPSFSGDDGMLDAMGDALPKVSGDMNGRLSVEQLQSMIPSMDISMLNEQGPAANPNRDQLPPPDTAGMSPFRKKEAFKSTNDANADLSKKKLENQVPGLATREGYVPSTDDAKQTKEVSQAVQMIDNLMTDYEALLEKNPNPTAGTPDAQRIDQLQGQIGAQIKALETLGAYDAGVQSLMKEMLGNPVVGGGTTFDVAANPFKAASTTYTKMDPEKARALNKERSAAFRKYSREKLKSTAAARGFEAPSGPTVPLKEMSDDDLLKALGVGR